MTELDQVEYYADDLKSRADWITRHVNSLINRPPYETRAEASLNKAEHALRRALDHVQNAKVTMRKLEAA